MDIIQHPTLKLHECWEDGRWDEDKLIELAEPSKTTEILMTRVKQKLGLNLFIWKPSISCTFSTKLAWEITKAKGSPQSWSDWIWHNLLPKKVSICMWRALFNYLMTDERVRRLGIPLVSWCKCCVVRKEETTNHAFSTSEVASMVWKKDVMVMGIFNNVNKTWRVKLSL